MRYYPTYHDLTVGQARTYFAWRSKVRNNIYEKVSNSYAYIYLYELLNGIGVENVQDGLDKLINFNKNYAQSFPKKWQHILIDGFATILFFIILMKKK